jgi:glycosyltransferase involved in cell wall biosynthesis
VTYFSKEFLIQGAVAVESFLESHQEASGLIVCLDSVSKEYLLHKNFSIRIRVVEISEISEVDEVFRTFLQTRSYAEAIISIKPHLIEYYLEEIKSGDYLIYFDADIYFFASMLSLQPFSIGFDVLLSEHLFPKSMVESVKFGKYNGGMIVFRKSQGSSALLARWKDQCTEWCKLELFEDKFADQKYLDDFANFAGVSILRHPGVNNGQYYFKERRRFRIANKRSQILVCGFPILSFHFHGIRIQRAFVSTGFNRYGAPRSFFSVLIFIYFPYLKRIRKESYNTRARFPEIWMQVAGGDKKFTFRDFIQTLRFTKLPHIRPFSKQGGDLV